MLKFTIFGERCSGTNFLEKAILENFELEMTNEYGWKHFWGYSDYSIIPDNVFVIAIIRNPYDWANSLYREKHHLPKKLIINENTFLNNEFYSIDNDENIIYTDLHIDTQKKYKNIFESRFVKTNYLINILPLKIKNYIIIKYEDLNENYVETLNIIKNKFNLKMKNEKYKEIIHYRGNNAEPIIKTQLKYFFDKQLFYKLIKDKKIEKQLGYI